MLNNIGPSGLIIILVVVLLLFGRGKIPELMGDLAKGIRSFKRGLTDDRVDGDRSGNERDRAPAELPRAAAKESQNGT